jgi:AbiV family abortive infection protein
VDDKLTLAARACLANGTRLLQDAEYLEFGEPPQTAYFLSLIAQEEIAKGFLIALVVRGVIPWDARLLRAARDHTCKQLLTLVMEYLSPDHDEFHERIFSKEIAPVPQRVVDAIQILRHEKIGRWDSEPWIWEEEPVYESWAKAVAEGKLDKLKQDALYVRLARDGSVASIPHGATYESVKIERDRADRMVRLAESVLEGEQYPALDFEKVEEIFRRLFETLSR